MALTEQTKASTRPKSLREHLDALESRGLLSRVKAEVNPEAEIGAICARSIDRGGPALLFENVKGHPGMPLVTNLLSSTKLLAEVFGTAENEHEIYERVMEGMAQRLPSVVLDSGPCKEEIIRDGDVDLLKFPTPKWHELDGGRYLGTTAGVVTRDPKTGYLNMGTYRAMIKDRNTLTLTGQARTARDPSGPGHAVMNEADGCATPVAIALGMDPYLTLASGTGVPLDEGLAEYEAAGTWRGSPTELVRCETNDLLVPAHAEIILEGEILPGERTPEGPHGEATGFYGQNRQAWVIKINCITQRKDPISYGLICRLTEDYPRALFRSGTAHARLVREAGLTNVKEAYMVEVGMGACLIVAAEIRDADEPRRIMNEVWDRLNYRWAIIVDDDCDVRDWNDVMWRIVALADPESDITLGNARRLRPSRDGDDEEYEPPMRGMGIDATMRFKDRHYPPLNTVSAQLKSAVAARWDELGLD